MDCKPWIEKYRPGKFNEIVLEKNNKIILQNIISQKNFPNLLFYGPPGTGKTTTIINLINEYHKKYYKNSKGLKIHLNASDDRGIDIIRNQINQFVNTKSIFGNGLKFVILDEVDYMTKNAQQALRYLIQQYTDNIRFCLICNYISKIDKSLQDEFITMCFCNLPQKDISCFLHKIIKNEKLNISNKQLKEIQYKFKSDIRSMINYIQTNHNNITISNIITKLQWEKILKLIYGDKSIYQKYTKITNFCEKNDVSIDKFIFNLIKFILNNKEYSLKKEWISAFEKIIHSKIVNEEYLLNFTIYTIYDLYKSL